MFTVEGAIEKHLVASLFAKTSQLIEASSGKDMDEILARHQDYLVMILNYPKLLLGRKDLNAKLRGVGMGLSQVKLPLAATSGEGEAPKDTPSAT